MSHQPTPASTQQSQFVQWLRDVAPYVHAFNDKTFVIAFSGELIEQGGLEDLVFDVSLLKAMGMRIVLIAGARPQIEAQLALRQLDTNFVEGVRVTDEATLAAVEAACGAVRLSVEAAFSQGLPNTPMAGSSVHVVSGNFITARPMGVIDGVDYQYSGVVRKVNTDAIQNQLKAGQIVLLSPLGFSPTGEVFNLATPELASAVASALKADKLIILTHDALNDEAGETVSNLEIASARALAQTRPAGDFTRLCLLAACDSVKAGVPRAHLIPADVDGSVLLELFQHDGLGCMITQNSLESLRLATIDDLGGILQLIAPLEQDGTLVPRGREKLEAELPFFSVLEYDGIIFGCAALYPFLDEAMGEMACFSIDGSMQGMGFGERMMAHIEARARRAGIQELFVLTTRTAHWFLKRGFVPGTVNDLPDDRQKIYNWQRRSQIFIKKI